jgi:hypothetical protein
LILVVELPL